MSKNYQASEVLDTGFLPVGVVERPSNPAYKSPCDVRCADDLPSRIYLGSLDTTSFSADDIGWSAVYRGAEPDTYVDVDYHAPRNQLAATFIWRGEQGLYTIGPGDDWRDIAIRLSMGFPKNWHSKANKLVNENYNARYIEEQDGDKTFTGFPDGSFKTILIPIPSYQLGELTRLLERIDADEEIAAPVPIKAVMTQSRVEYRVDLCDDVPANPLGLAAFNRKATGLSCHTLPAFEWVEKDIEVLAVDRWIYLLHIGCTFRDLFRVLDHCQAFGLIGSANKQCAPSHYPDGEEWSAQIIPGGFEQLGLRLHYFDETRSRRIAYGTILTPEHQSRILEVADVSRYDALKALLTASVVALAEPDITVHTERSVLLH
jgi:hypothetical protein